jgi:hypothetical protein
MSVAQRSRALVRLAVAAVVLAAVSFVAMGGRLLAQQPQNVQPRAPRVADMLPQPAPDTSGDGYVNPQGQQEPTAGRYDEPPSPPFDYWQPTWMPCQSLRVNRSLVLGHLYWGMDILGWSTKGVHVPPLVTSSSLADAGVIGSGDTAIRFGGDTQHDTMRPGGRLTIGWWFDPNQYSGVEWNYLELDERNRFAASVTDGSSVLARPFVDPTATNQADQVASDTRNGSIHAVSNFQLTSMEIVYRKLFWSSDTSRFDYLIGYRHAHLADRIRVNDSTTFLAGDPSGNAAGSTQTRFDQFRTVNQFDGLDLGIKGWWSQNGCLALTGFAKTAFGATNNTVNNNGTTTTTVGRNSMTTAGGVLTQASNIGHQAVQDFGTLTEVGLGLQWRPGCYWNFDLGYTWLYWNQVARAGDQINTTVDVTQATNNPAFRLHTTSFWAQGINGGFTYQF